MKGQAVMQAGVDAPRRLALPSCPQCNDLLFASAAAEFVSKSRVRHVWSCDACGHEFATSVRLSFGRARQPLS
jgi:transcription elongation factor Elf1